MLNFVYGSALKLFMYFMKQGNDGHYSFCSHQGEQNNLMAIIWWLQNFFILLFFRDSCLFYSDLHRILKKMKKLAKFVLIMVFICQTTAKPKIDCIDWKEIKNELTKLVNSPTTAPEEIKAAQLILLQMSEYEKKNPKNFVAPEMEKLSTVFYHSMNVLSTVARSNGNPCLLWNFVEDFT